MTDDHLDEPVGATRPSPRSPREALQPEPAPAPPRASRRARSKLVVALSGIFTFLVLVCIGVGAVLVIGKYQFESAGPLETARNVTIPRGQGLMAIAKQLEREGIIDQAWVFLGGIVMNKARDDLKYGEYLIPEQASMHEVMDILVEGKAILYQVTIPEGYTSEQIVARLRADPVLVGEIAEVPAEGTLLPETYSFDRGTSRSQMIDRMRHAQARVLEEVWERRADDVPISSPEELVTLASIVEKETGRADERPRVAGVFINRMKKGMRLQSDPTILYGLYGGKAFFEPRTLTRSELDAPNAYNTYQIDGLPPTPIANPGRAAMEAVANPSRTEELFFVADGTGGHIFAASLDEHNRNVAKWREVEKRRREQAEREAQAQAEAEAETESQSQGGSGGGLKGLNLKVD
ncbi:endolytic transglycosylase MltG [Microbaculum marinum]|uniref:Endolytic murein transglycosylase n=1 Tax=Microbaculum marinum TaxID=1764581 RepID=A0AAW9RI42_9HYPH